jgi:hypothetical protein
MTVETNLITIHYIIWIIKMSLIIIYEMECITALNVSIPTD